VAIALVCSWLGYIICKFEMDDAVFIDRVVFDGVVAMRI